MLYENEQGGIKVEKEITEYGYVHGSCLRTYGNCPGSDS